MDCTSDFQDEKLTIEPICNTRRTSWGRSNLSCRFRSNGASVSATMVRHGYAVDYRQHSGLAYASFIDRKCVGWGKRVSVGGDRGGGGIIKKTKEQKMRR